MQHFINYVIFKGKSFLRKLYRQSRRCPIIYQERLV